ncbi:MAG: transcriptional repressor LexA [Candidatus Parcubacteria bacterium]|nr:transcriptional repressor LexA [Candidatus Parcubacteria bacterium]
MLGKKQKKIYDYITSYIKDNEIPPSLDEIAEHCSLGYASSAHYHVKKLEEEGYLERYAGKPRGIGLYAKNEVHSPRLRNMGLDSIGIPVLGTANAGPATLFAEEEAIGHLKVSKSIVKKKDGVFALKVDGDSMNKAQVNGKSISDGDFVVIDSEYKHPKDGDYVLSVLDGCANLKKFSRDKKTGEILLLSESDNPKHKPIYVSSEDSFMVNGKIIAVVKR